MAPRIFNLSTQMEVSCQLHVTAVLLLKKQSLEPTGWEVERNSESVRRFRRRGSESCYQFDDGDDVDDDNDDNGKDGENSILSI